MKRLTLKETMDFVEGSMKFGMKPGLHRISKIMEGLGNPQLKLKCIHVAGTNGKGSVCSVLNRVLVDKGLKVGLFISPYLEDFRERIQINDEMISTEDLISYVSIVKEVVDKLVAEGMEHPTEFEIITAVMFIYFKEKEVDYAVVEVGLGGDLDSTNVLKPILSVITSISYDHMGVLGNSIEEIAVAKAGIIKKAPVVTIKHEEEALNVIKEKAKKEGARLVVVREEDSSFISFDSNELTQRIHYKTKNWDFIADTSLIGVHQFENTLLAVTTLDTLNTIKKLNINEEDLKKALKKVLWPGRLETMNRNPLVLLDGAHNTDGIKKLKKSLDFYLTGRPYTLILGILADKETHKMGKIIAPEANRVICVTPLSDRASKAEILADYIRHLNKNTSFKDDYEEALEFALSQLKEDEYIIISGSLYMVGEYRKILKRFFNKKN